ncbi:MAG: alpha-amylase family protein [Actinobacteria bacterium]|nr:alpha-amylase family protein [Actinomycetota bacterium]
MSDVWWKNAVVYCLDVETYMDGNGDGVGDFKGLTERVDYLAGLGVTCVWLMPFYPSPNRDDGYDITDFYGVDPRLGTLGDFVEFVHAARDRGIRVIADLVVNHTSHEHPWFESARSDPDSPYRDWYVWLENKPDQEQDVIFPDAEDSNWEWDERAQMYYLHRFYAEQPDLNVGNPDVVDEIHRIMGFWLQLGVSGFRVDAVPFLIEETAIEEEMPEDPHVLLHDMRRYLDRRRGDAIMLGEVNLEPGEREAFFGEAGDEMVGLFNFVMSGATFLALAHEDAEPLARHLKETPTPPDKCQWFNFIRNHDELNLSKLPAEERKAIMDAYAQDEDVRIFDRGIRRRTPPMLDGDQNRMRLMYSLLFTLPGSPVLWYGEEIGMGDELSLEGRMAVRTPMQWSGADNGGFSTASSDDLVRPMVKDPDFAPAQVNVMDQRRDRRSLLNWMERALRLRKECPELGWGHCEVLDAGDPALFVTRIEWEQRTMFTVHNLATSERDVSIPQVADYTSLADVFSDGDYEPLEDSTSFTIAGSGYRWIRALRTDDPVQLI